VYLLVETLDGSVPPNYIYIYTCDSPP